MPVDFVPTLPVGLSLSACGLLPAVLLGLSHGPLKVAAPGRRFIVAVALTWIAWLATSIVVEPDWVDLIAGGLLLATASLAAFTLWTLIAWGFTLSMLLALAAQGRPLTEEEWALAYTRGQPLEAFARDRIGVLLLLGLAKVRGDDVVMVPRRGWLFARLTGLLRKLFGLSV